MNKVPLVCTSVWNSTESFSSKALTLEPADSKFKGLYFHAYALESNSAEGFLIQAAQLTMIWFGFLSLLQLSSLSQSLIISLVSTVITDLNLNEKGLGVSSTNGMFLYEYDSLGDLIQSTSVHPQYGPQYTNYEYECNNMITRGISIFYEYYNKYNTIGNENKGMAHWGKQNNCLVKYEKTSEIRKSYTYKFDSLDRVIEEKLIDKYYGTKITKYKYY